jgi:hypothetical protein
MSFTAIITADAKGFERAIDQAQAKIDGLEKTVGQRLSSIGDKFTDIGRKASVLSAAIVAAGGASFKMAADFQDAIGATDQIFKDASDTVNNWAKNLSSDFGIAKEEALKYSNLMGSMLINIGQLTEEQAAKQSAKLIELAGDLTAMYGGTTQDAVRALTGALKGNSAMLDNYGMAVNDALIKLKAFELGLSSGTGELSLQAKQAATLALIWEQTGAAQGQASREADTASGAMRALAVEVKNLSTEIGEVLLPIITPIVAKIRDFVSGLRELSQEMLRIGVVIAGVVAAAGPLLVVIGKVLQMLPLIKVAITALTGPVGLVVAAVAAAATLIIKYWDEIKAYFTSGGGAEAFTAVKELAVALWNDLKSTFNAIKDSIVAIWNRFGPQLTAIWKNTFDNIKAVIDVFMGVIENVADLLKSFVNKDAKGALDSLKNLFIDIFNSIARVVTNALSSVSSALAGFLKAVGLDKWSESVQGFANKMADAFTPTKQSVNDLTDGLKGLGEQSEEAANKANKAKEAADQAAGVTANAFEKLVAGMTAREAIQATTLAIEDLQSKIVKLQTGILPTSNLAGDLAEANKQLNELTSGLDLLTGGREINIDVKFNTQGIEAEENKFFKDGEFTLPEVDASRFEASLQRANEFVVDWGQMVSSGITDIAGTIGDALGSGNFKDLGKGLIESMGKLAQQFGSLLIGMGVAALNLQTTLITKPWLAIAAGAALVALGAAATAKANKMVENATGGGGSASYQTATPAYGPSEYRGPYRDEWAGNVTFKIGNNELVGVLEQANKRNNRIG